MKSVEYDQTSGWPVEVDIAAVITRDFSSLPCTCKKAERKLGYESNFSLAFLMISRYNTDESKVKGLSDDAAERTSITGRQGK